MIALEPQVRPTVGWGPDALDEAREARREHQESIAHHREEYIRSNRYFYSRFKRVPNSSSSRGSVCSKFAARPAISSLRSNHPMALG